MIPGRTSCSVLILAGLLLLSGCASFDPPPMERTGPPESPETTFPGEREPGVQLENESEKASSVEDESMDDRTALENLRNQRYVKVRRNDDATIITVAPDILFDLRSAKVRRQAWPALDEVAKYLARRDDHWILVAGHTDSLPTRTRRYPSNWELSALRAVNVVKYLSNLETLDDSSLIASGFGKHHPVASNKTEEGREKNRRLEIFVLEDNFTGEEYPGR